MRYRRSLHLATRVALLSIFLGSPVAARPQSSVEQPASALPKPWNDAVAQLADKIAASVSPSTPVTLDVKNISSLDSSYTGTIQNAFRSGLRGHSFNVVSSNSASAQTATQLHLTLSESADSYVWVAEIPGKSPDSDPSLTSIVSVPRNGVTDDAPDSQYLSLEKRFIWKQPEKFLDFALMKNPAPGDLTLLILEMSRLTFYKMSGSQWQIFNSNPIPQHLHQTRDPEGAIHLEKESLWINNSQCVGKPDLGANLICHPIPQTLGPNGIDVPGLPNGVGTHIPGTCRGETMFMFTGDDDWTTSDVLQGYLQGAPLQRLFASGAPIKFEGPVMSLTSEPDAPAARAVVHNLKTGNYEAYIVTATCSH